MGICTFSFILATISMQRVVFSIYLLHSCLCYGWGNLKPGVVSDTQIPSTPTIISNHKKFSRTIEVTYETRKSDTTRSGMVRCGPCAATKIIVYIFRTSCAIATKLKIKNHYMKKNPEPQNSEMIPFSSAHILDFRSNLPVPPLPHPSCSETHLMPGSLIAVDLVPA